MSSETSNVQDTLIQKVKQKNSNSLKSTKQKIIQIIYLIVCTAILTFVAILMFSQNSNDDRHPVRIKLALPQSVVLNPGNSRVIEVLFYSGADDRGNDTFKIVNQRNVVWTSSAQEIVSVDSYGRIQGRKEGIAKITVATEKNKEIYDTKTVSVIKSANFYQVSLPKRIVNYTGLPVFPYQNLQKVVTMLQKQDVKNRLEVPESIKKVSQNPENSQKKKKIIQDNGEVIWTIVSYADKSNNTYIQRLDNRLDNSSRDIKMRFIGNRYLPGDGKSALSIEDDSKSGIWVVNENGDVSHIQMVYISYEQKAEKMVENTQKYVLRQGIASGANYNQSNKKWISAITDNDGLWTSLYASGQLMRYDYLRQINSSQKINQARLSAFTSLKAVLITDWISGRLATVDAKIRYFNNSRTSRAYRLSSKYLKKNRTLAIQNYVGSPCDKIGYYGLDANHTVNGAYYGGSFKYSLNGLNEKDWTETEEAATTKRNLQGFMARTFGIPELDGNERYGGLFFRRYPNGSHQVLSDASALYDYTNKDTPFLSLGNESLPQILQSNLFANGKQYNVYDMVYKGDTSTDEVIGHLFLYKIAFDIMDQNNSQQKQLKQLIQKTMINLSTHLIDNGYQIVDATGQGTSWSKLVRDFLNNDYTTEDSPLKALQLLLCFKLTYYMTGDEKYQKQYQFLVNDENFNYARLVGDFWERWIYFNQNQDFDVEKGVYRFNLTQNSSKQQLIRHHFYTFHYSDDEQAMLAFYLIFQIQTNETLLNHYKKGLQAFWNHINKSENPLWYYIYQLAYPNRLINDGFGHKILQTASWQLSRHPIDMRRLQAFVQGSRFDVIYEGSISVNPFIRIENRTNQADIDYVNKTQNYEIFTQFDPRSIYQIQTLPADQRSLHKFNGANYDSIHSSNSFQMQPSTTYTLPYWFGIYHNMLKHENFS